MDQDACLAAVAADDALPASVFFRLLGF